MYLKKRIIYSIYKLSNKIISGKNLSRFKYIKLLTNYATTQRRTNFEKILGHKMYLDEIDSLQLSLNGIYEKYTTKLIQQNIKSGYTTIDIGANIGYYTLIMAKKVGLKGQVFAFEPEPNNFKILQKNIEINQYQNVILENKGAFSKTKSSEMYLCDDNKGMHRIYASKFCNDKIIIQLVNLDDYFKNFKIDSIHLVKIDVEGVELEVLKGMQKILQKNKNIKLFLEFVPNHLKEYGTNPQDLINFLIENGFEIYMIDEKNEKLHRLIEYKDLLSIGSNIFCKRAITN